MVENGSLTAKKRNEKWRFKNIKHAKPKRQHNPPGRLVCSRYSSYKLIFFVIRGAHLARLIIVNTGLDCIIIKTVEFVDVKKASEPFDFCFLRVIPHGPSMAENYGHFKKLP
jgi:hypothetical protein